MKTLIDYIVSILIEILKSEPFKYRKREENGYVDSIYKDPRKIEYHSIEDGKINMKNDLSNVKNDFKKSVSVYKEERYILG